MSGRKRELANQQLLIPQHQYKWHYYTWHSVTNFVPGVGSLKVMAYTMFLEICCVNRTENQWKLPTGELHHEAKASFLETRLALYYSIIPLLWCTRSACRPCRTEPSRALCCILPLHLSMISKIKFKKYKMAIILYKICKPREPLNEYLYIYSRTRGQG